MNGFLMIQCRGKCHTRKAVVHFRPSDARSSYPICRACRKAYAERGTPGIPQKPKKRRGWAFREQAFSLCAGSAAALDRAERQAIA